MSRLQRETATDDVLTARVRSALGRLVSHPGAIQVRAENGTVTMTGHVLAAEMTALRRGVASVRGVREVIHDLTVHTEPGRVAGLQGGHGRPQPRPDLLQSNWAPGTRLLMGVLGGTLALRGIRSEGPVGALSTLAGLGVLARATTNLEMRRLTGLDTGRGAVDIHKVITVNAPVEQVFAFWSDFENFPRFMSHLREVRRIGDDRSHWVAEGPAGITLSWDAEVTGYEENRVITWKSVGPTPIENGGIVRFDSLPGGRTRLDIRMSYTPPAGAIGHMVASLLHASPRQMMDDDLVRLKSLLEGGRPAHTAIA